MRPRPRDDDAERTREIERALCMLSRCEPSRAANVLNSDGLADLAVPGVIEQLASKHLSRKAQLPPLESYGDYGDERDLASRMCRATSLLLRDMRRRLFCISPLKFRAHARFFCFFSSSFTTCPALSRPLWVMMVN